MWRAWRAWCLGPALAAFTAGAPTPAPPVHDDVNTGAGDSPNTGAGDSPPGDASVAVERRRDAPADDYFAVTRPASSPLAPPRSPSRHARAPGPGGTTSSPRATKPSVRDLIASSAVARAVKTRAAFATWRRVRMERFERRRSVLAVVAAEEPGDAANDERRDEEATRVTGYPRRSSIPFFDRRRAANSLVVAEEEPEDGDGEEGVEDGDEDGEERVSVSPRIEPAPSDSALDDPPRSHAAASGDLPRGPPTWRDAERELREASDALVGSHARPYPRDDPGGTSRDWFLAEDRSRAVLLAERARAATMEANRIPAYAAADPEVVTGAVRELRASGRWRDPRTLTHGSSAGGRGRGRGGRSWR